MMIEENNCNIVFIKNDYNKWEKKIIFVALKDLKKGEFSRWRTKTIIVFILKNKIK